MKARTWAMLGMIVMAAGIVRGQAMPGGMGGGALSPEQQQAMQEQISQLQGIRDQVLQNVQNAGIDPAQFTQEVQQQMQDGTLDFNTLQQQLIQKGYMTPQMLDQLTGAMTQLQGTVRQGQLNAIKIQLNAGDEEWAVLLPKIQRIVELLPDAAPMNPFTGARTNNPIGGNRAIAFASSATTPAAKAFEELQRVVKEQNPTDDRIAARLTAWRELHQKAEADLLRARIDLTNVCTLRQEAILLGMGIL